MPGENLARPRCVEVLAFIVERIARSGSGPSYEEIGRALRPHASKTRVAQLVKQLILLKVIERDPGAKRGIRIRDLNLCRSMIEHELGAQGWWHARPLGPLEAPEFDDHCTLEQLPMMPPFEHHPDVD